MKSYAFLAATGYYVVDQSLTTTSNAHQMQDKEQEYMHVEKLVLHKKNNKQCMANSNAIFQKRKSKYSSTTITCNHSLRTYLPTYSLTHAIHEWVSAHVGTKPIWQMTKEFQLEGVIQQ